MMCVPSFLLPPCFARSPAPACGHQGYCPRQTDLGQTSSALNKTHVEWGTSTGELQRGTPTKRAASSLSSRGDQHPRSLASVRIPHGFTKTPSSGRTVSADHSGTEDRVLRLSPALQGSANCHCAALVRLFSRLSSDCC